MQVYLSDVFSATRHHSRFDAILLTAKGTKDAEDLVKASRVVGNDPTGIELVRPPICRYCPDNPQGDIPQLLTSALFGATFKSPPEVRGEDEVTFESIKKVLVQILSDV